MKVGSLFSGIGGLDLGLERAGMEIIWQVEIDPFCQKVLKKHWPGVPCYGDIKEIDFTTLPRPDLICGGFPCQPWSMAGRREGILDDRNLWPQTIRTIRKTSPPWVLLENVPGLLTHEYFGRIIGELASCGYIVEWQTLSAETFGAPHKRERLFIVAYSRGISLHSSLLSQDSQELEGLSKVWCKDWEFFALVPRISTGLGKWRQMGEPGLVRIDDGVPQVLDRLRTIGNAVVPQVAEWIGRRILEVTTHLTTEVHEMERLPRLELGTVGLEVGASETGEADE